MDGRFVKEDTVGSGGYPVALATAEATEGGTGMTLSSTLNSGCPGGIDDSSRGSRGREWEALGSPGSGKAKGTALCGYFWGQRGTLPLEWDALYTHAAPPSLFTHTVHGCSTSHFCGWDQLWRFLGSARDVSLLTVFFCLVARGSHQTKLPEIAAHSNSPTRVTSLTRS